MHRSVWLAARLVSFLVLLFAAGYAYGLRGGTLPFTSALFTFAMQSASNTFTTPSSFVINNLVANGNGSGIDVTWVSPGPWAASYSVYRSTSGDSMPSTVHSTVTGTTFNDSADQPYY